jgi:hypothetical protein
MYINIVMQEGAIGQQDTKILANEVTLKPDLRRTQAEVQEPTTSQRVVEHQYKEGAQVTILYDLQKGILPLDEEMGPLMRDIVQRAKFLTFSPNEPDYISKAYFLTLEDAERALEFFALEIKRIIDLGEDVALLQFNPYYKGPKSEQWVFGEMLKRYQRLEEANPSQSEKRGQIKVLPLKRIGELYEKDGSGERKIKKTRVLSFDDNITSGTEFFGNQRRLEESIQKQLSELVATREMSADEAESLRRSFKYRYTSNSIVAIYPLVRDGAPNDYDHVTFYGCFDESKAKGNSMESSYLVSDLKAIDYSTVKFYGWDKPRRYSTYRARIDSGDQLEANIARNREKQALIDLSQAEEIISHYMT